MLVTAASNTTLTMSTSRIANRDNEARAATPTPVPIPASVGQADSGSETLSLSDQIREQMEQDPDYQILRRAFALDIDHSKPLRQGRVSEATPGDQFEASSVQSVSLAESFEIRTVATRRLEISVRAGEAAFMTAMAGANAQRLELNIEASQGVQVADPLVLDLGGWGITTTGVAAGVDFDLNGDGRLERMSTVTGDSWFLALDWNENGRIDDGRELFGDQNGAEHGFAELARHDDNGDARIDAQDAIFARLRLVQLQADGSQAMRTLDEAGVTAIELSYQNVNRALNAYDHVAQTGRFIHSDGRQGEAADVMLGYHDLA